MKTELTLVLNIHVAYRVLPDEIGTTDELNRSEIIKGEAEILAIQAETQDGKFINITDLVPPEDMERLVEQCTREGKWQ